MASAEPRLQGDILLVEDDADLAALHAAYLKADGHLVRVAGTGREALELVQARAPDIVLLDVLLPDIDGFEVCRQIKANPALIGVSVVLVTSMNSIESRTSAFEANADEFVAKPAIREEMHARIQSMLRLRSAVQERQRARLQVEQQKRERIRQLFGRYVSRTLIDRLADVEPEHWNEVLGRTLRTECTVMFTDVRGFTAMSEALDAEDVVQVLNAHFSTLTEIVHTNGGTVLNMTGDGLLIAFGAPMPHDKPNRAALEAARAMHAGFADTVDAVRAVGGPDIGLGIGIHAGPVICGNVGSESYMAFTVIGDTVNVAARAQAEARPGRTIVTASVFEGCADAVDPARVMHHGEIELRGRQSAIELHEIDMRREASP